MDWIGPYPLPEDPALRSMAQALDEAGYSATLLDPQGRIQFFTGMDSETRTPIRPGDHAFGPEATDALAPQDHPRRAELLEVNRNVFKEAGGIFLHSMPGGRDELRAAVSEEFVDLVDDLEPADPPLVLHNTEIPGVLDGITFMTWRTTLSIIDTGGRWAGLLVLFKPAANMNQLSESAVTADLGHLQRMAQVTEPRRRPAAILMADLESSSLLARRLSTMQYFSLAADLVRVVDDRIVDAGGIVGRHVGDGIVGFFLEETTGSASEASRRCIETSRSLRTAMRPIADGHGLHEEELTFRFGLHWGGKLLVGRIQTRGRSEVTVFGDEVNEAARIEACATGGRTLASKDLIEQLDDEDAGALGLDPATSTYTPLGDLPGATEKARRDAPSIAVCEV